MYELEPGEFGRVSPLFQGQEPFIPPNSVLLGNTPGRVFVDNSRSPSASLVWTKWGYAYLAGETADDEFSHSLHELLFTELVPTTAGRETGFMLYPGGPAWEARLGVLLEGRMPRKVYRRRFRFNPAGFSGNYGWLDRLPAGFHIYRIDEKLIEHTGNRIRSEIEASWGSTAEFLELGFGFCLMYGDEIASLCTSPFVAGLKVEVCIRTAVHYRCKGFATVTAFAFIEHCLLNELLPNWECFSDHMPSCSLAKKLGFEAWDDHAVYYWEEVP